MTDFEEILTQRLGMFERYIERAKMDRKQYQYDGVKWMLKNEIRSDPPCGVRGGFIADEMGLGKTIMMIGLMLCNFMSKTLIVVPPVLIDQWWVQIYRTTGHKALIYHGANKNEITLDDLNEAKIVITSYGSVTMTQNDVKSKHITMLHRISWNRIIFDEAHHLRNQKTTRYFSVKILPSQIRWLVSGTPIQNKKKDFFNLCSMIRLPASYYTNFDNLIELTRSFIMKRTKASVGIKMEELNINKRLVDWKTQSEMQLSKEIHSTMGFSNVYLKSNSKIANVLNITGKLASILRARQSCIYPKLLMNSMERLVQSGQIFHYDEYKEALNYSSKLDAVVNTILERKDNGCGKIVFCHFREEIDDIAERLIKADIPNVMTLDGRTTGTRRYDALNNKNDVLILQIQTGCEGLNLQENYSEIYFVSPHWNPAIEDQAIARCHRIGQNKPVFVYRFAMSGFVKDEEQEVNPITVDTHISNVQHNKRSIAVEILGE